MLIGRRDPVEDQNGVCCGLPFTRQSDNQTVTHFDEYHPAACLRL